MAWLRSTPVLPLVIAAVAQAADPAQEPPPWVAHGESPPRALIPETPGPSGLLVVVGMDVGSYGIGSGLAGTSLGAKLGMGWRTEAGVEPALVVEADYGVVNLPLRASTGNYWVLPQLDLALVYRQLRLHAFVGAGWGEFQRPGGGQREVVLYGGGVGFGWSWFDANVRWLAPDSALRASGTGSGREAIPGIGTQLTLGLRFDWVL